MSDLTPEQVAARGRALEQERWELPSKYRLTPEMLAKSDEDQARLAAAAALPFGSMSPQDAERARSVTIAESLRVTLSEIDKLIGKALVSGEGDLAELTETKTALRHQLAERQALIGRYDLAAENEPDPAYRERYIAILEAVWRDDNEWCGCGPLRGSGEQAGIEVTQQVVEEEVFSVNHGQVMMLLRCNACGFRNVAALPDHLRQQRAFRARARQIAGSMDPQTAEQTLVARRHTAVHLLKSK